MFLDTMDATNNQVNTLFSNAANMSQEELDTRYGEIEKDGKIALALSGKF